MNGTPALPSRSPEARSERRVLPRSGRRGFEIGDVPVLAGPLGGPGAPLPHLERIQRAFGRHDVSRVRAHVDSGAAAAAERLDARAFTVGEDVAFNGAPDLRTAAHEAAHTVQQRATPVQAEAGVDRAGDEHEQQANQVAELVVQGRSAEALLSGPVKAGSAPALQRLPKGSVSTEREAEVGEETTHRFSFNAKVKLPVYPGGRLGPFSILDSLSLSATAGQESAAPLLLDRTTLSSLRTQAALTLINLEVPPLELSGNRGKFSLEGSLAATGGRTRGFGPDAASSGDLGLTGKLEGGYESPSLVASRIGGLTLNPTLGFTGKLNNTFGGRSPGFSPSFSSELGLGLSFSRRLGLLGRPFQLSAEGKGGLEYSASKSSLTPSGSLTLGLTGEPRRGVKTFVEAKISGEAAIDLEKGGIKPGSPQVSVSLGSGVRF